MDFKKFLREVKTTIEFLCPENPLFALVLFLTAMLRQVLEKDKTLADRIVKHLNDMTPLIRFRSELYPDKKYVLNALANFRLPDMRGRVKPKKLQNILEEYEGIYEKVKPILKRRYRNPEAKMLNLKEKLAMKIPKERLKEWLDCKPSEFTCKCIAYKHNCERHSGTILRNLRRERKENRSTFNLISKLAKKLVDSE